MTIVAIMTITTIMTVMTIMKIITILDDHDYHNDEGDGGDDDDGDGPRNCMCAVTVLYAPWNYFRFLYLNETRCRNLMCNLAG
jgi:hypothetical protein